MAGAAAAWLVLSLCNAPAAVSAPSTDVVELPILFSVKNTNNTDVRCQDAVDGLTYNVRGVMVGPRDAIAAGDAATLYLHAVTWDSRYFDLDIPGHNFVHEMASRGHVSIAVDRIGHGNSGKPEGLATCFGSEADVAHQMVDDLKSGHYTVENGKAPRYQKVFVSGSSVGGMIANIEAYTFHDVAGVYNQSWGDVAAGPYAGYLAVDATARCYQGGETHPYEPGAPPRPDYVRFAAQQRDMFWFHSATKEVRLSKLPPVQLDPCGQIKSLPFAIDADMQHLGEIDVPVLQTFGTADPVFPPPAAESMQARYRGSPKVTTVMLQDAGHFPVLETAFPAMIDAVDAWLTTNGG
jgi:alpha-beta hydrolase superfamily lysophospholipase